MEYEVQNPEWKNQFAFYFPCVFTSSCFFNWPVFVLRRVSSTISISSWLLTYPSVNTTVSTSLTRTKGLAEVVGASVSRFRNRNLASHQFYCLFQFITHGGFILWHICIFRFILFFLQVSACLRIIACSVHSRRIYTFETFFFASAWPLDFFFNFDLAGGFIYVSYVRDKFLKFSGNKFRPWTIPSPKIRRRIYNKLGVCPVGHKFHFQGHKTWVLNRVSRQGRW